MMTLRGLTGAQVDDIEDFENFDRVPSQLSKRIVTDVVNRREDVGLEIN